MLGFLLNGFAPLVDALDWLKYLSLFYYYEGHDPIGNGIDTGDIAVARRGDDRFDGTCRGRHAAPGSSHLGERADSDTHSRRLSTLP